MALTCVEIPDEVLVDESVDLHMHLRNLKRDGDGRMEMNMRHVVNYHAIIVAIGNSNPPVLDQASTDAYLADAYSCLSEGQHVDIYAAPLMTDKTTREIVLETRTRVPRNVLCWKAFLSGVSNDYGNSVTDFRKIDGALFATYDPSVSAPTMPVHVHAERKFDCYGKRIAMCDREWYAIDTDIRSLLWEHRDIVLVIKHVSDVRTLEQIRKWRAQGFNIYAEICPQYLFRCHEDLYEDPNGGTAFNLHELCWPLYKGVRSMQALREAVLSGEDWVMFGADWACHADDPTKVKGVKVNRDGIVVGGLTFLAAHAKSVIIGLFVEYGSVAHIDSYLSTNARNVHHLPPATKKDRYVHSPRKIPFTIEGEGSDGTTIQARLFMGGHDNDWVLDA